MKKIIKKLLILFLICFLNTGMLKAFAQDEPLPQEDTSNETLAPESTPSEPQDTKTLPAQAVIVDINSNKLDFYEDKNQFVATGGARVNIKEQGAKLEAEKITYNQNTQIIIAEGNVVITKYGKVIKGDFARIDMTKQSALIDKPHTVIDQINIKAENAEVYPDKGFMYNGQSIINNGKKAYSLSSGDRTSNLQTLQPDMSNTSPDFNHPTKYKIRAKEVIVTKYKNQSVIALKYATIYEGKRRIVTIPSLQFVNNKEQHTTETNLPEIGYNQQLGRYFGPAHVFSLPNSAALKVAPIFAYGARGKSGYGGGFISRYTSATNRTQVGYTTVKNLLAVRGEQNLIGDKTKLYYSANDYVDNGMFGVVRPKYLAEIADERELGTYHNFTLYSRESAGYAEDLYRPHFGTLRAQVQGEAINDKPIWAYKDYLQFRVRSQVNLTAYGTGDVFALARIGPNISSNLGKLYLSATYFQGAIHGQSPFYFDRYSQGKSNISFNANLNINKYLSIGNYTNINVLKDNWNNQMITSNQIYTRIGPEDLKFKIGIDTVTKRSLFGFDIMVGSGYSAIDFDKLKYSQVKK